MEIDRKEAIEQAKNQHLQAIAHYNKREFEDAYPLFLKATRGFVQTLTHDNPHLNAVCFNFGSNLYEMHYYGEAIKFLKLALTLKTLQIKYATIKLSNAKVKNNPPDSKREQEMLTLCQQKLRGYSKEVQQQLLILFKSSKEVEWQGEKACEEITDQITKCLRLDLL